MGNASSREFSSVLENSQECRLGEILHNRDKVQNGAKHTFSSAAMRIDPLMMNNISVDYPHTLGTEPGREMSVL